MFQDWAKSQKTVFQQWNGSWHFADRLREVELNLSGDTAYYIYDSTGNRCRKVVEKRSIREERYYLEGYEVFRKFISDDLDFERQTLHVSDDTKKFATLETKTIENATPVDPIVAEIRYQYDNHLGSACLELDQTAQIISYEEYHPFGTTSYRSGRTETEVSLKCYKYVGKERDEETGFYYYGMRFYAGWLCRFVSVDPMASDYPSLSPYAYCANNPVLFIDPDGQRITFGFLAFKSRHLFNRVYRSADVETRAKYDALKSSSVNYRINMTNLSDRAGGTTYNFAKDRVDVNINPSSSNMVGTIGDELETAYQYEVGDIGFVLNNAGVVGSLGYDMNDEVATKRAEIKATEAVNTFEGINIQLDKTTEAFRQADTGPITPGLTRDQMIENYFILNPSASQYLNQFQPGIKGVHTGGANMKNRISGTGGYTLQQLNEFKNSGAIKDFKYNGE